MNHYKKRALAYGFAGIMAVTTVMPNAALAESNVTVERPSAGAMVLDVALARPLLGISTILGVGAFVVTLPFSVIGGNVEEVSEALVVTPFRATVIRCLGCTRRHVGGQAEKAGY